MGTYYEDNKIVYLYIYFKVFRRVFKQTHIRESWWCLQTLSISNPGGVLGVKSPNVNLFIISRFFFVDSTETTSRQSDRLFQKNEQKLINIIISCLFLNIIIILLLFDFHLRRANGLEQVNYFNNIVCWVGDGRPFSFEECSAKLRRKTYIF